MEFFYPNWINDFWRIMGLVFTGDKKHFECKEAKRFNSEKIVKFCTHKGIALYDTAAEVRRMRDNASDKYLEIVTPSDIPALLATLPYCTAIATTGQKATDTITATFGCKEPSIGHYTTITIANREISFWRMPSTSRAYPLAIEKKAEYYRTMFIHEQLLDTNIVHRF